MTEKLNKILCKQFMCTFQNCSIFSNTVASTIFQTIAPPPYFEKLDEDFTCGKIEWTGTFPIRFVPRTVGRVDRHDGLGERRQSAVPAQLVQQRFVRHVLRRHVLIFGRRFVLLSRHPRFQTRSENKLSKIFFIIGCEGLYERIFFHSLCKNYC